MFDIIEALKLVLELEGKLEDLVKAAQEYIANVKSEKKKKAILAAWELRKTDPAGSAAALRDLMFEDGDPDPDCGPRP